MRHTFVLILVVLLACGCEGDERLADKKQSEPVAVFRSIVALRANQRTLLAPGPNGRIYILQPDAGDTGAVQYLDPEGTLHTTELTPGHVARQLGEPLARGGVRSMAPLPGADLAIYYTGATREKSLACILIYDPASGALRVAAGPEELARSSQMGLTHVLADAQLARAGDTLWLWLRHVDQTSYLSIKMNQFTQGRAIFTAPFSRLSIEEVPIKLTVEDRIYGAGDGSLYLLRPETRELWRVGQQGELFPKNPPRERPGYSVPPILVGDDPRRALRVSFFGSINPASEDLATPTLDTGATRYPMLLLERENTEPIIIDRDQIDVRLAFPLHAMRITNWIVEPRSGDIVAYDAMSGEVFRISFTRR